MIISLGRLTKKNLLFLLVPTVMLIRRLLTDLLKTNEKKNMFYPSFLRFLGRSFHGITWLIIAKISNRKKKQDDEDKTLATLDQNNPIQINPDTLDEDEIKINSCIYKEYEFERNEKIKMEKKNNYKKIFLLIIVCIIDFLAVTSNTMVIETKIYSERSNGLVSLALISRIFLIAILSYFIIKGSKMYSHHYVSFIIILIVVIVIIIFSAITDEGDINYFLKLGLLILPQLLYSIMYVCGAKYLLISEGNIYKLLFIEGILGIILSIILQAVVSTAINNCDSLKKFFNGNAPYCYENDKNENKIKTMIVNLGYEEFGGYVGFIKIIVHFLEVGSVWLIIFNFSVNHFGAIQAIPSFVFFILDKENEKLNALYIVGIAIIVFMAFVYNEIFILRFCGLDKNTVDEISKRSDIEKNCNFGKDDDDDIPIKSNDNYLIMKSDIDGNNGENSKNEVKEVELSLY